MSTPADPPLPPSNPPALIKWSLNAALYDVLSVIAGVVFEQNPQGQWVVSAEGRAAALAIVGNDQPKADQLVDELERAYQAYIQLPPPPPGEPVARGIP